MDYSKLSIPISGQTPAPIKATETPEIPVPAATGVESYKKIMKNREEDELKAKQQFFLDNRKNLTEREYDQLDLRLTSIKDINKKADAMINFIQDLDYVKQTAKENKTKSMNYNGKQYEFMNGSWEIKDTGEAEGQILGPVEETVLAVATGGTSAAFEAAGRTITKKVASQAVKDVADWFTLGATQLGRSAVSGIAKKMAEKSVIRQMAIESANPEAVKFANELLVQDSNKVKNIFSLDKVKTSIGQEFLDDQLIVQKAIKSEMKVAKEQIKIYEKALKNTKDVVSEEEVLKSRQLWQSKIDELTDTIDSFNLAAVRKNLERGSSAQANNITEATSNAIFGDLKRSEIQDVGLLASAERDIELTGRGIQVHNPEASNAIINELKSKNPEYYNKLKSKVDELHNFYDSMLDKYYKEGMITKESYQNIKNNGVHYNPRIIQDEKLMKGVDPELDSSTLFGTDIVVNGKGSSSGIDLNSFKNLKGSKKAVITDPQVLLDIYTNRMESALFKNRANKSLYEALLKSPENNIGRIRKGEEYLKQGEDIIKVRINGNVKEIITSEAFAKHWKGIDPILSMTESKWLGWVTGATPLKAAATGYNPFFAISNTLRDMAYVYMSPEYKAASLFQFGKQVLSDYKTVFKDVIKRDGIVKEYIKHGGGMGKASLTSQGKIFENHLKKTQDILGWLGETSELLTRTAHMNRALLNGKTPEMAAATARSALDFGRSGRAMQAINTAFPYINAGVQGTRGMMKFAKSDPKLFAKKMATLGTTASTFYLYNVLYDNYDNINPITKKANWIIMLPLTYKDDNGKQQNYYIKIPKDPFQSAFTAIFENEARNVLWGNSEDRLKYKQDDTKMVDAAVTDFLNMIPGTAGNLPPMLKAMMAYRNNIDPYFQEDIVKESQQGVKKELQYNKKTPEIYKKIGASLDMSPEKLRVALSQFTTNNNIIYEMVGSGLNATLKSMSDEEKNDFSSLIMDELKNKTKSSRFIGATSGSDKLLQTKLEETGVTAKSDRYEIQQDLKKVLEESIDKEDFNFNEPRKIIIDKYKPDALKLKWINDISKKAMKLKAIQNQGLIDNTEYQLWAKVLYESKSADEMAYKVKDIFGDKLTEDQKRQIALILGKQALKEFYVGNK